MQIKMLSIIISTYNRQELLQMTLDSLSHQEDVGLFDFEVIVVDNNSNDNTKGTVDSFIKEFKGRLRYVFETRQGKSHALNTAIHESKGDILIFTDDDIIFDRFWLKNINDFVKNYEFDAMGGRVIPQYPRETPTWITENSDVLCGPIVSYEYGDGIRNFDISSMVPFIGANMVIKKEALKEIGLFNTNYGPGVGTFGEDTDIILRLAKAKKKLFYCGKAFVWHPVSVDRMNLSYIAKWKMAAGKYYAEDQYVKIKADNFKFYFGIPRYLIRKLLVSAPLLVLNIFNKREFLKLWSRFFINVGMMVRYRQKSRQNQFSQKDVQHA